MANALPRTLGVNAVSSFLEDFMDILISMLDGLWVPDAVEAVADCIDFGRLPWLVDYATARELLYNMEVDTYVR